MPLKELHILRGLRPPIRCVYKVSLYADLAHLVERHIANVKVAGSSPVICSRDL